MMDQEQEPQEGGPEEATKMAVNMLTALTPVLQEMGAPKEVQAAANTLLSFLSGAGQEGAQPAPGGAENAAGNPNARPMA